MYCECSVGVALLCGEYSVGVALGVFVNVVWAWPWLYGEHCEGVAWVYGECSLDVDLGIL